MEIRPETTNLFQGERFSQISSSIGEFSRFVKGQTPRGSGQLHTLCKGRGLRAPLVPVAPQTLRDAEGGIPYREHKRTAQRENPVAHIPFPPAYGGGKLLQ